MTDKKKFKLSSSVKKVNNKPVFRQRVTTKPLPVVFGIDKEPIQFDEELFEDEDRRMEFIVKVCGVWYSEETSVMGVDYLCQQIRIRKSKKGKKVVEDYLFSDAEESDGESDSPSDESYGGDSSDEKLFSSSESEGTSEGSSGKSDDEGSSGKSDDDDEGSSN